MDALLAIKVLVQGTQAAESNLKGVGGATKQVGTETEQTTKQTSKLRTALGAVGSAFAVYKGYQFIKGAVTETTSLAKATAGLQRITGLDSQTAAGWVQTAKERGVQSKQLNQGFITLARNITSAASGSKASASAFAQLGLNAANLKVQDTRTQMGMLADSFAALPAGVDKAALAQKLFGRQAQTLLPLLNKGSAALNEQIGETAKSVGMSNSSMEASLKLAQQQRALSTAMVGVKVAVATALLPILSTLAQAFTPVAQAFAGAMQHSGAFRVIVVSLTGAMITWIAVTKLAALAGLELNAAWLIIPALLVGIGLALVTLYNKCAWFRNGVQAVMGGVSSAFKAVKNAAVAAFDWIKGNWPLLLTILGGPFGAAAAVIIKNFNTVKSVVLGVFDAIKSAVGGVVSALSSVAKAAGTVASIPGKVGGFIGGLNPFQSGGTVGPSGEVALVGERGPEIVSLPAGTAVTPNHRLGGGGAQVIHTHVWLEAREIAHAMGTYVAGQQARR